MRHVKAMSLWNLFATRLGRAPSRRLIFSLLVKFSFYLMQKSSFHGSLNLCHVDKREACPHWFKGIQFDTNYFLQKLYIVHLRYMYQKTKIDMLKLNSNKKRSPPAHLPGRLLPYPTIAHAWPPPREHRAHSTADFQCSFSSSSQLIPMAVLTLTTPQQVDCGSAAGRPDGEEIPTARWESRSPHWRNRPWTTWSKKSSFILVLKKQPNLS
jgi:hypothetical protein